MSIPCKMRPAGLESLPLGYIRLEFIEQPPILASASFFNAYIATDVPLSDDMEVTLAYTPVNLYWNNSELWILGNAANGVIVNEGKQFQMIAYTLRVDTMCWGGTHYEFNFPAVGTKVGERHVLEVSKGKVRVDGQTSQFNVLNELNSTNTVVLGTSRRAYSNTNRLHEAAIKKGGKVVASYIPAIDSTGRPCMLDLLTRKPFHNGATKGSDFIAGLTMAQALNLANLPVPTTINTLTISLPKEATLVQYNQEVNAAIATAEGKGWSITVKYRDEFEDASIQNKYAECKTVADIKAVNSDYKNDLTEDGEWIYPLENLEAPDYLFFESQTLQTAKLYLPKAKTLNRVLSTTKNMTYAELKLGGQNVTACYDTISRNPKIQKIKVWNVGKWEGSSCFHYSSNLEEVEFEAQNLTEMQYWFVNDSKLNTVKINDVSKVTSAVQLYENCIALEEFPTTYPSLSNGQSMFNGCRLKKQHAVEVLSGIPRWTSGTHKLTIGIHIDHKYDPEVNEALKRADANYEPLNLPIDETTGEYVEVTENKGWQLTVQWNGTATENAYPNPSATYSLRSQESPVFAKLVTEERPDGTTENFLDWGHYVSNWEENGYMEFASLEEAYEHFNLEMPAED